MQVRLKGVHTVTVKLADGRRRTYHYAWRGGPRLTAEPGSPDFLRQYQDALDRRQTCAPGTMADLVRQYKASGEFKGLADSTRREYGGLLDLIRTEFGATPVRLFDDRRMRKHVKAWRDKMAATPRKADHAVSVLSAVLSYGLDQGELSINVARGIARLHTADRSDVIWTPGEIDALCAVANEAVSRVVRMAALTGMRQGDLLRLPWGADKGTHIDWVASKSAKRGRRVIIPIMPELRALLDAAPKKGVQILLNTRDRAWTPSGLKTQFGKAKDKAGIEGKTFHDLRGTAATYFCLSGLDDREVAEIMGWSENRVAEIRRRYVAREAIILSTVDRLTRAAAERGGNK